MCGNIANLLGVQSVTPQAIAYVAVQVCPFTRVQNPVDDLISPNSQLHFALSSATSWNKTDGCFSYPIFYNNIVDFFENTPGPAADVHIQELLSWWTT